MNVQLRFWNSLDELKQHCFYIYRYKEDLEKHNRNMNMFLAFVSNSSIGAWIIWQELDWLWAAMVAISQVINAVRPYLATENRLKALRSIYPEMESIFLKYENQWYAVSEGRIAEDRIFALVGEMDKEKNQLFNTHLEGLALPTRESALDYAKDAARSFFRSRYGIVEN